MSSKKKTILLIATLLLVIILAGFAYWFIAPTSNSVTQTIDPIGRITGFQPLNRPSTGNMPTQTPSTGEPTSQATSTQQQPVVVIPSLRLLSDTPVGGYGASTTARTTFVRWVDRGRGNVIEAHSDTLDTSVLSNTVVPRTYTSLWNRDLSAFIASVLEETTEVATTLYAGLIRTKTVGTSTPESLGTTPYELKGQKLPPNIISYATSPRKDKVFMLIEENGRGVGYVSTFQGSAITRIFDTPLTQLVAEWPEENTITLTTKASSQQSGFLYFVNPKTGIWKKVLGPTVGLTTRTSHDAKQVFASFTDQAGMISSALYTVSTEKTLDPGIKTLAEKCVWGNFYKHIVYCGVPTSFPDASYPDDWYKGTVSTSDKIWDVNATTGEVRLVTSLSDKADRIINSFNLQLDERDDFLFFMNKNDLSLWSLDLVSSN
ncbi:MAG: hypothetical protein AAB381_01455 [Patescibacteria group bacterium]